MIQIKWNKLFFTFENINFDPELILENQSSYHVYLVKPLQLTPPPAAQRKQNLQENSAICIISAFSFHKSRKVLDLLIKYQLL
jgi:hypothetical protein